MCSDDVEHEVIEILRREALRGRKHTADSSWHDRSLAGKALVERSWLESLLEELSADGICPYAQPSAAGADWPDCEAVLIESGKRVAVEVTEVVKGSSLAPGGRPEPWTREEFLEAVQARLIEKDAKGNHGGKYAAYVVLLHSDEMYLGETWVREALRESSFRLPYGTVDVAYLILGYAAGRRAYFRLTLTG